MRHYINLRILFSIVTSFSSIGPFELNWETQQYKCWISQYISFSLLASLQAINLFWGFLIARIGFNVYINNTRKDERSDDELTEAEDHELVSADAPIAKRKGARAAANGKAHGPHAISSAVDATELQQSNGSATPAAPVPNGVSKKSR